MVDMLIPHMTTAVAALKIILLAQGVSTGELKKVAQGVSTGELKKGAHLKMAAPLINIH
ncbi:hypothetical protein [Yersinia enterocolitica]|uniref:hypothetical protein n=1 Tax=Yersinia enterocolitica TaxID=630 RepID=UPI0013051394|nr:hypothetical protein [Yersinia enterocolitica]